MTASATSITEARSRKAGRMKPDASTTDTPAATTPVDNAPKTLRLPVELRGVHDELLKAHVTPFPAVWDDGVTYVEAKQPAAIAKVLIRVLHHGLTNAKIAYVFRKSIKHGDGSLLGKASKIGGKLNYFSGLDLLVEINHDRWQNLSPERRIALIDHELTHFTRGDTSYELVQHDIEEFGVIVRRWGLWTQDVERFASSVERARQLDIFSAPVAAAAAPTSVQ